MNAKHVCCGLAAALTFAGPARADGACAAVGKALAAALAQPRIHAAIDRPLDAEALRAGFKPTLMHSIVIDGVQYSNAMRAGFARTPLASPEMRLLAGDLAPFAVEQGCQAAGSERIAGRDARVYTARGDSDRGEVRLRLWVDAASGLPLRAVTDEPDVDVDDLFGRAKPKAVARRMVGTHAYLFGAAVKPPGAAGALDPATLVQLQALLKGRP
jgi:hypothetical protein